MSFEDKLNSLANTINAKTGIIGKRTIDELEDQVNTLLTLLTFQQGKVASYTISNYMYPGSSSSTCYIATLTSSKVIGGSTYYIIASYNNIDIIYWLTNTEVVKNTLHEVGLINYLYTTSSSSSSSSSSSVPVYIYHEGTTLYFLTTSSNKTLRRRGFTTIKPFYVKCLEMPTQIDGSHTRSSVTEYRYTYTQPSSSPFVELDIGMFDYDSTFKYYVFHGLNYSVTSSALTLTIYITEVTLT